MGKFKREVKAAAKTYRKNPSIHREKLFGGLKTAEEVHGEMAFPKGAKCQTCSRRPLVRAITLAPVQDAIKHWPEIEKLQPNQLLKRVVAIRETPDAKNGAPYVRIGVAYACKSCAPLMEKTLAQLPSWVLVEINRAKPDRFVMGAGGGSAID